MYCDRCEWLPDHRITEHPKFSNAPYRKFLQCDLYNTGKSDALHNTDNHCYRRIFSIRVCMEQWTNHVFTNSLCQHQYNVYSDGYRCLWMYSNCNLQCVCDRRTLRT